MMTPAPRTHRRPRLSDDDIAALRAALADGKKPRVTLHGNQFGDGVRGQVLAIGDPTVDGPEFITVRAKLAGTMETLQFGPDELHVGAATRKPRAATKAPATAAPVTKAPATKAAATKVPAPEASTQAPEPPVARPAAPKPTSPAPSSSRSPSPAPAAARSRRPRARQKQPAVTITLASSGEQWTLSATRGGRSLQKSTPVPPGSVLAAARLFDAPALQQAVGDVVAAAKAEAQQRAGQLRDELAQVQSLLDSLDAPKSPRR
ncbi:hypothetical protein [Nakamurella aerolata]|uniref:Uncharacterized protein n=1 Tax=Nakamurella aerolata TaxID=1656892 RepID=A0A849A6N0_9ACTN|nr:hypothetical protein [Nakamurella aerolata]NNG34758.1 hypothetical protein [Nakamurella aerolata]